MNDQTCPPAVDEQVIKDMLWAFAVRSPEHAALLIGTDGRITWTNAGAEVILGAQPGGLVGLDLARIFTARDVEAGIPDHERVEARARGTSSELRARAATDDLEQAFLRFAGDVEVTR